MDPPGQKLSRQDANNFFLLRKRTLKKRKIIQANPQALFENDPFPRMGHE